MILRIKKLITALSVMMLFGVPVMAPAVVYADDIANSACSGTNLDVTGDSTCDSTTAGASDTINNILKTAVNIFSVIVGFISVIMIIVGGLKYITSGGDSGNVSSAKNTILFALVGLVVVVLAQVIVKFVLAKATSATV